MSNSNTDRLSATKSQLSTHKQNFSQHSYNELSMKVNPSTSPDKQKLLDEQSMQSIERGAGSVGSYPYKLVKNEQSSRSAKEIGEKNSQKQNQRVDGEREKGKEVKEFVGVLEAAGEEFTFRPPMKENYSAGNTDLVFNFGNISNIENTENSISKHSPTQNQHLTHLCESYLLDKMSYESFRNEFRNHVGYYFGPESTLAQIFQSKIFMKAYAKFIIEDQNADNQLSNMASQNHIQHSQAGCDKERLMADFVVRRANEREEQKRREKDELQSNKDIRQYFNSKSKKSPSKKSIMKNRNSNSQNIGGTAGHKTQQEKIEINQHNNGFQAQNSEHNFVLRQGASIKKVDENNSQQAHQHDLFYTKKEAQILEKRISPIKTSVHKQTNSTSPLNTTPSRLSQLQRLKYSQLQTSDLQYVVDHNILHYNIYALIKLSAFAKAELRQDYGIVKLNGIAKASSSKIDEAFQAARVMVNRNHLANIPMTPEILRALYEHQVEYVRDRTKSQERKKEYGYQSMGSQWLPAHVREKIERMMQKEAKLSQGISQQNQIHFKKTKKRDSKLDTDLKPNKRLSFN